MLRYSRMLAVILACVLVATPIASAGPCEDLLDPVEPCTCVDDVLDCSDVPSGIDLLSIPGLQNGQSLGFKSIQIAGNDLIEEITSGAFGNHYATENYTFMRNPRLQYISGRVFSPLGADTLQKILVWSHFKLHSFPFDAVRAYPNLVQLNLGYNGFRDVPPNALAGASLSLTHIYLEGNELSAIGAKAFYNLSSLSLLYLFQNQLSTLASESLKFSEDVGQNELVVNLGYNMISDFETDFMNPLDGTFQFISNQVEFFEQSTWEPILANIVAGDGHVTLNFFENPFVCDCRMAWLYHNKEFAEFFSGPFLFGCKNIDGNPWLWDLDDVVFSDC